MAKQVKQGVRVNQYGSLDFDGQTLDDAIKYLKELKKEYGKFDNLRISSEQRQWDDGYELVLIYDRFETDAEEKIREEQAAEAKAWRQKQFESLKKEFER